jgi:hypothetical protein
MKQINAAAAILEAYIFDFISFSNIGQAEAVQLLARAATGFRSRRRHAMIYISVECNPYKSSSSLSRHLSRPQAA